MITIEVNTQPVAAALDRLLKAGGDRLQERSDRWKPRSHKAQSHPSRSFCRTNKLFQEGDRGEDRNRAGGAGKQVVVAGDDVFGAAGQGTPDELVIGGVGCWYEAAVWPGSGR